jgi:hypothetical protein
VGEVAPIRKESQKMDGYARMIAAATLIPVDCDRQIDYWRGDRGWVS